MIWYSTCIVIYKCNHTFNFANKTNATQIFVSRNIMNIIHHLWINVKATYKSRNNINTCRSENPPLTFRTNPSIGDSQYSRCPSGENCICLFSLKKNCSKTCNTNKAVCSIVSFNY